MLPLLLTACFIAGFVQGSTGFGFGLIAMSCLPLVVDVRVAVPVVAVLGFVVSLLVLWRWRHAIEGRRLPPLLLGIAVGTPLGVHFLTTWDRRGVLGALGLFLLGYGLLALRAEWRAVPAESARGVRRGWGVLAGLLGGLLGGAFNTGGPPIIVYANARRWPPSVFRANLQVLFLTSTSVQLLFLARAGLLTKHVGRLDLLALPALLLGVGLGTALAGRIPPTPFRRAVLVLLTLFGVAFLGRAFAGIR